MYFKERQIYMIIRNKHLMNYYNFFNVLFWCVVTVIVTLSAAAGLFDDFKSNTANIVMFVALLLFLCAAEQAAYISGTKQILDIFGLNDNEILFLFQNKSVVIQKSDCIKIVETNFKYTFFLKNGKKMRMNKERKLFSFVFLKSEKVNYKNFPCAAFVKR